MLSLKGYMNKVGVTKKKYVQEWIDLELIPGVEKRNELRILNFQIQPGTHIEAAG